MKILSWTLLTASILFLIWGFVRGHEVYDLADEVDAAIGLVSTSTISERQLVIDSTFSGVQRKEGELWSTYDRTAERTGKQACPT